MEFKLFLVVWGTLLAVLLAMFVLCLCKGSIARGLSSELVFGSPDLTFNSRFIQVVAHQPEQVARLSIKNVRGRDMSALFLKQSHSKMIGRGKWVKKNLIITFLSVFVTLLLLQACSDHKENRMRVHSKNRPNSAEEEIATWKKLIGTTYRVEGPQFVDFRFLPNSGDSRILPATHDDGSC